MAINIIWKLDPKASAEGTSLALPLHDVTNEDIKRVFGRVPKGAMPGVKYSSALVLTNNQEEVEQPAFFLDGPTGVYTLYTSYGEWRIGAGGKSRYVKELAEYVREKAAS